MNEFSITLQLGNPDTSPWEAHNGGVLSLYDNSASGNNTNLYALKMAGRNGVHEGPKHPLNTDCFVVGSTLVVEADIKLINATDQTPFNCDALSGPSSTCPIVTLETVYPGGNNYNYAGNEFSPSWDSSVFNAYKGFFALDTTIASAQSAGFIFERVPAGIDIILDNVQVYEFQPIPASNLYIEGDDFVYADCNDIVTNGDAEVNSSCFLDIIALSIIMETHEFKFDFFTITEAR